MFAPFNLSCQAPQSSHPTSDYSFPSSEGDTGFVWLHIHLIKLGKQFNFVCRADQSSSFRLDLQSIELVNTTGSLSGHTRSGWAGACA